MRQVQQPVYYMYIKHYYLSMHMCELTCHSYKVINYYGGVGIHAEYILNSCLTNMYIRYIEGAEKI